MLLRDWMLGIKTGFMLLGVFACLGMLSLACKRQSRVDADFSTKKTNLLTIGNGREPVTLDPHKAAAWADLRVIEGLFEGLVVMHPVTKKAVGGVAEEWESSEDGLVWRFKLRADVRWSDGSQLTAHDFVRSAKRMLGADFGSEIVVHFLYPLKNAEAYHLGAMEDFAEVGIRAPSDWELEMELDYPSAAFLTQLSYFFPVKEAGFPENSYWDGRKQWGRDGATTSNGAYQLLSWNTNEMISLKKNPYYWDADSVAIEQIQLLPIEDMMAEERAFRNGQIQITSKVPSGKIRWYQTNEPTRIRMDERMGLFFIQLNHSVYPLHDRRVRQALAKTVNREAIVDAVLKDGKPVAEWIVPPSTVDRLPVESPLSFDPEAARHLFELAGFPGGSGFPKLTFSINSSAAYQALAETVQYSWKEELGIEITIVSQEWKAFLGAVEAGDFEIARYGYVPLYPDPYPLLKILTTGGTENFTGWSNASFDRLVDQAKVASDPVARNRLLKEAENLLLEDVPVIPVFFYNSVYLIDPRISGWEPDLMDRHPFKFLDWKDQ